MISYCEKCNEKIEENIDFCPDCGGRILKKKYCVWCKELINNEASVCPHCKRNPNSKTGDKITLIVFAILIFLLFVAPFLKVFGIRH